MTLRIKMTAITMSQKGELIYAARPSILDSEDFETAPNVQEFWEDMETYLFADNQELFVHAAEYFSPDSDDIKPVPKKGYARWIILFHIRNPRDVFNNLVMWLVKEHEKVTQVKLTLQTKDRDIIIYIQKEKDNAR